MKLFKIGLKIDSLTKCLFFVLFYSNLLFSATVYAIMTTTSSESKTAATSSKTNFENLSDKKNSTNNPIDKETMIHWSRQLGVTCIHCHNLDNFKDENKPTYKIAFKHNQMVRVLQEEVFSERDKGNVLKVKVDCYMCHRGKEVPAYIEPPVQLTK